MTIQQRTEAYRFVLKRYEEGKNTWSYACINLTDYARDKKWEDIYSWPEFEAQKPWSVEKEEAWFTMNDIESRKTALKAAIKLAKTILYHETVKTAVNDLGFEMLPIPMNNCAKVLHQIITMNGVSCQDKIKAGHRARIADLRHMHGLDGLLSKEKLIDKNEFGESYYYMRHFVKPEHVAEVVLAYLRINVSKEVKKARPKVLAAMFVES